MKLWIDDIRSPPDDSWTWAQTIQAGMFHYGVSLGEAMKECTFSQLQAYGFAPLEEISFDHDLGGDDTSMPLAHKIEEFAGQGIKPPKWRIHSMNPVGRANLEATMQKANQRYAAWLENYLWLNSPPVGREEI